MKLYSTKGIAPEVDLREAVLSGLPPDNGLYMPVSIPVLPASFLKKLPELSLVEIGFTICRELFGGYIEDAILYDIIQKSMTFPAPLVSVAPDTHILELFHGPSLAFKDFGARFMAQLMAYFNKDEEQELLILVATSGDTGGAVASGFAGVEGINVCILYPSGKVSALQEKQLTTHGGNIKAIEIAGSFDDCQDLVKAAFLDQELQERLNLSSANSINIARLIPQTFYYFEGFKQLTNPNIPVYFSVPSGNFGNLTAGVFAHRMGLPIAGFLGATNRNDVVPDFLQTGVYQPRPSVPTLSNAMDVGNPSNFRRLDDLFCSTWNNFKALIHGFSFSDIDTEGEMRRLFFDKQYLIDPHGAVASLAWTAFLDANMGQTAQGIIIETAHPAKFQEEVERILDQKIELPTSLEKLKSLKKEAFSMDSSFTEFKEFLLNTY
ncbi:MAG: threonine synthase [Saprospiraceae bacterium]|nr:threonine synthase [Saprospiraceae bacterium]